MTEVVINILKVRKFHGEEFYSRFIALKWLIGEYEDTDYAHSLDRSRHKAAFRVGGGL